MNSAASQSKTEQETLLAKFARRQRVSTRIVRLLIRSLFTAILLITPGLILFISIVVIGDGFRGSSSGGPLLGVTLVLVYVGFFVLPFLLTLPVVLPLASTNRNVYRIIFFRKFNTRSNKHIRRYIRRVVGQYGHVFTLSDSMFKVNWYVRIPLFLGQFSLFHFRLATIKNSKGMQKLRTLLEQKGKLNINWYMSRSKIFAIKTTDEYWKDTAKVLLEDANMVMFEITELTEALDWEVKTVVESGQDKKVIFTANLKYQTLAEDWKAKCDPIMGEPIPLIIYDHRKRKESEAALHAVVQDELATQPLGYSAELTKSVLGSVVPRAGGVLLLAAIAIFFISPYLFPRLAAKYSPIYNQAYTGYMYTYLRDTTNDQTAEVMRLKEEWGSRTTERLIEEAWDHPECRCVSVLKGLYDFRDSAYTDEYLKMAQEAEPDVASVAFRVIKPFLKEEGVSNALIFLDNGRKDSQFMALELLEGNEVGKDDIIELLDIVATASFVEAPYPYQHQNSRRGRGEGIAVLADMALNGLSLRKVDTAYVFYSHLKELIAPSLSKLSLSQIKEVYQRSDNTDLNYLLSYSMLEKGSGAGLLTFFEPQFMDTYYFFDYGLFGIYRPYRTEFRNLTLGTPPLDDLPTTEELLAVSQSAGDSQSPLPGAMIDFLLVNFANLSVEDLGYPVEPEDVYLGLHNMTRYVKGNQAIKERIAPHKHFIEPYLSSEELEDRLSAASLLAYVGDSRVLPIIKEAVEYNRPTLLFSNLRVYPYRDEAQALNRVYNVNAR